MAYMVDLLDKALGDLRKDVQDKLHNHYNMFHLLYKNIEQGEMTKIWYPQS